jgi:hypothetical protein
MKYGGFVMSRFLMQAKSTKRFTCKVPEGLLYLFKNKKRVFLFVLLLLWSNFACNNLSADSEQNFIWHVRDTQFTRFCGRQGDTERN